MQRYHLWYAKMARTETELKKTTSFYNNTTSVQLYAASKVTRGKLTCAPLSESADEFDVTMGSGSASL